MDEMKGKDEENERDVNKNNLKSNNANAAQLVQNVLRKVET